MNKVVVIKIHDKLSKIGDKYISPHVSSSLSVCEVDGTEIKNIKRIQLNIDAQSNSITGTMYKMVDGNKLDTIHIECAGFIDTRKIHDSDQ